MSFSFQDLPSGQVVLSPGRCQSTPADSWIILTHLSSQIKKRPDDGRRRPEDQDLAATGHLAVAACERYPSLQAVVFDLSEAVPLAQEMIAPTSAAARVSVVAGNFFTDELPEADLFAVGRILHDWSEDKIVTLLRKVYERLPSGGALLVAEKVLDDNRAGPVWEQMQSLNMLLVTEGKERTLAEYEVLLRQAGFAQVEGRKTSSPLDAVLAVKK